MQSDLMTLTFGVLFGSSVLIMLILVILIGVAILIIKRKSVSQRGIVVDNVANISITFMYELDYSRASD